MSGYVNLSASENPSGSWTCVSFTMLINHIVSTDVNSNNELDDGEYTGVVFNKPFSDSLMAEVTNGWYIEGPGLNGRVQITGGMLMGETDKYKFIIITSHTTYYSLQFNVDYTFYSPECINNGYVLD